MNYRMVECKTPHVDFSYQRVPKDYRVKKLVSEWDDLLANPMVLSEREDGTLWVLDGNHTRLGSLQKFGDNAILPARVYTGLSIDEEAAIFTRLNTSQQKPSFNEILKAKRAAGDEFVIQYFDALDEANLKYNLSQSSRSFRAHSALMKVFKNVPKDLFVRAVKAGIEASAERPEFLQIGILPGFCSVITRHPDIDSDRLVSIVQRTPIGKIIEIADSYKKQSLTGGGAGVTAQYRNAFIDLYNAKLRKNKIEK